MEEKVGKKWKDLMGVGGAFLAGGVLAGLGGGTLFAGCVAWAFLLQLGAFVPAYLYQTEKYYDLMGSVTYLTTAMLALFLGPGGVKAWVMAGLVGVWTIRLGSFLFLRIHHAGKDRRFDRIKPVWSYFLLAWVLQGLWVSVTAAPAWVVLSSGGAWQGSWFEWIGLALWCFGLAVEGIADEQKRRFRLRKENRGRFIDSGLWGYSRHPNYAGEITLWLGVALVAAPSLVGFQLVTLISPLFVYWLLTQVSGVNLLEEQAERKWGEDPRYQEYVEKTAVLFPFPRFSKS